MEVNILTKSNILVRQLSLSVLCCLPLLTQLSHAQSQFEDLNNISSTAVQFALTQIDNTGLSNIEANTNKMDPRLRLARCENPLEAFTSSAGTNLSRMTIGIRCNGIKPWSIYVPVSISAYTPVAYSTRPLVRGEELNRADIEIRQMPLSQMPANYINNIEHIIGMEMTRSLRSDTVLNVNHVRSKRLVSRGQEVIILAQSENIEVRMNGVALGNGAAGELIQIRNVNSGRTIEAKVVDNYTVEVNL